MDLSRKPALAGILLFLILVLLDNNLFAQDGWYINTNLQFAGGNFIYNSNTNVVSLYGGLRYQNENFGISFSIPVVGNNNNSVGQAGGMMVPIGNSNNGSGNMNSGNMMGGGNSMMGSGSASVSGMNVGVGDLFLLSNYQLLSENDYFSDVIINAQIKF